ncbi:MAG: Gfo/Idh/MocA family oxidoreductase [Spirochaetaceae bacterium]|nr:Gfo/Idh/MocA family oxidoreductase [Spirochaetaceae bacterium]
MDRGLRFGIVGAGYIAEVVAKALDAAEGATLAGVASRRRPGAEELAARHAGARVFDSWEALLASDGVDAVYVATPTAAREEICVAAARKGKHVLAEKPFADLPSYRRIADACRGARVAFMDATHFVHHPRTALLKRELGGRIGRIRAIDTRFFFPSADRSNIRYDPAKEPTGAIGDMAWYSMRSVAEFAPPDARLVGASGFARRDPVTGAVVRGAGTLRLSDGSISAWNVGYDVGSCVMDLCLLGERGAVTLDDFVLDWASGFKPASPGFEVGFAQRVGPVGPAGFERVRTHASRPQIVAMVEDFAALARDPSGPAAEECRLAGERTQALLDAAWAGLSFEGGE